jgi:hypothetical protein
MNLEENPRDSISWPIADCSTIFHQKYFWKTLEWYNSHLRPVFVREIAKKTAEYVRNDKMFVFSWFFRNFHWNGLAWFLSSHEADRQDHFIIWSLLIYFAILLQGDPSWSASYRYGHPDAIGRHLICGFIEITCNSLEIRLIIEKLEWDTSTSASSLYSIPDFCLSKVAISLAFPKVLIVTSVALSVKWKSHRLLAGAWFSSEISCTVEESECCLALDSFRIGF